MQQSTILPIPGSLISLKTKNELEKYGETVSVYICEIPRKSATKVLSALRAALKTDDWSLRHLRRFVNFEYLPQHIQHELRRKAIGAQPTASENETNTSSDPDGHDHADDHEHDVETFYVLICPTHLATAAAVTTIVSAQVPSSWLRQNSLQVEVISVPAYAPTSVEHANQLSSRYWPTVFMNTNPFGPHPTLLAHAQAEIQPETPILMAQANALANEARQSGLGIGVGVVVVERKQSKNGQSRARIVAGAGDGRFKASNEVGCADNPARHAVIRAIALVARQRRRVEKNVSRPETSSNEVASSLSLDEEEQIFADVPQTPLEHALFEEADIEPGGYLCLDLEFYITHEPCLMCSMALVHSRVGRVIIAQEQHTTGGLSCREVGQGLHKHVEGYGLHWRDDLNWRFLCWKFTPDDNDVIGDLPANTHV